MQLGTAKITAQGGLFVVTWMNHGSFLQNEPRGFWNAADALAFCRERTLRVVGPIPAEHDCCGASRGAL